MSQVSLHSGQTRSPHPHFFKMKPSSMWQKPANEIAPSSPWEQTSSGTISVTQTLSSRWCSNSFCTEPTKRSPGDAGKKPHPVQAGKCRNAAGALAASVRGNPCVRLLSKRATLPWEILTVLKERRILSAVPWRCPYLEQDSQLWTSASRWCLNYAPLHGARDSTVALDSCCVKI